MIGAHKKAVLQFSGGVDSLALLYCARPWLDAIEVHFVDPGAVFPEVVDFVERTCAKLGARLVTVRPEHDIRAFHDAFGLPADLLPARSLPGLAQVLGTAERVQPWSNCCGRLLFGPAHRAVLASAATLVLRGVKACDERKGVPPGTVDEHGITYEAPLWDWSDADVLAYLRKERGEIPAHYAHVKDSLDCWLCSAHLSTSYGKARLAYIREHRSELWPDVSERVSRVLAAARSEFERIAPAAGVLDGLAPVAEEAR
jgi:3'-phosphoadenosine 5'-phosphosulfate sulfotransferase (PAPS reductase)/FAD synthetase